MRLGESMRYHAQLGSATVATAFRGGQRSRIDLTSFFCVAVRMIFYGIDAYSRLHLPELLDATALQVGIRRHNV